MINDPVIDRIREARHIISEECGHDPKKLIEYYIRRKNELIAGYTVKTNYIKEVSSGSEISQTE